MPHQIVIEWKRYKSYKSIETLKRELSSKKNEWMEGARYVIVKNPEDDRYIPVFSYQPDHPDWKASNILNPTQVYINIGQQGYLVI